MNWQLLLAISVSTYAVSILLQRILLKDDKSDPVAYSIVFQLVTGLVILVYALVRGFSVPNLLPILPNLILMTFLYGVGNVLIFKSLKAGEASEFTIVFATRVFWTIAAAIFFLGEAFSLRQGIGTLLIIASIILVSWKDKRFRLGKGGLSGLGAALCFGLAFANDAFILRNFDVPSYLAIAFIVPALMVWLFNPRAAKNMLPLFEKAMLKKLLVLAVLFAVSAITIFLAYQVGKNAAQIAVLGQTATIVTVLLAIVFLREKNDILKKIAGAAISLLGVILVL
ncbi:MAG: EamA family transporter [bacterium]|nr:EamA family transporter [bacterium]